MSVQLTAAAKYALISVGTNRQGAMISSITTPDIIKELKVSGLIGNGFGLTRHGTIVRQQLMDTTLDMLF